MNWNNIFRNIGIAFIVFVIINFTYCKKKNEPTPDYGIKANITGSVSLFDEGSISLNNDSMIVSIWGSNPLISDTTDMDGLFVLRDVLYGSYSISFQKIGYGFHIMNNVVHEKGETIVNKPVTLGQFSSTQISTISAKDSAGAIIIRITTLPDGNSTTPRHIRLFFHDNDMVNFENFTESISIQNTKTNPVEYRLNPHTLEDMGFISGQTVWVKSYGNSYYANEYIDPVKGLHIYPNLNLHSVAATSFVVH